MTEDEKTANSVRFLLHVLLILFAFAIPLLQSDIFNTSNQNNDISVSSQQFCFPNTNPTELVLGDFTVKTATDKCGIIELFYKNQFYNTLVLSVKADNEWNNAESEQLFITSYLISDKSIYFDFPVFPNGSEVDVLITLTQNEPQIQAEIIPQSELPIIQELFLGNYSGISEEIRYVQIGNQVFDARDIRTFPESNGRRLNGDNYKLGDFFFNLPTPRGFEKIIYWGDNAEFKQYQMFESQLDENDYLAVEVRDIPWNPSQTPIGQDWLETIYASTVANIRGELNRLSEELLNLQGLAELANYYEEMNNIPIANKVREIKNLEGITYYFGIIDEINGIEEDLADTNTRELIPIRTPVNVDVESIRMSLVQ